MKPKLVAFPINADSCRVWCPYCVRWHFHGCDDVERRRWTHRVAHCGDSDSPFHDSGYWIKLASEAVHAEIAKADVKAR